MEPVKNLKGVGSVSTINKSAFGRTPTVISIGINELHHRETVVDPSPTSKVTSTFSLELQVEVINTGVILQVYLIFVTG